MASPTLKDIGREAGVSAALVSVVLNNKHGRITATEENRRRIQAAARKLGYRANPQARALRLARSFTIGVLAYKLSASFVSEILEGIEHFFLENDYTMLLASYRGEREFVERAENFRRRAVDGLLVIAGHDPEFLRQLAPFGDLPKVVVGGTVDLPNAAHVRVDSGAVVTLGARALLERGHRELAFFSDGHREQLDAWRAALAEFGVAYDAARVVRCLNIHEEGYARAVELLRADPAVTGVMTYSDELGAAVLNAAADLGRPAPENLSVVGVDDRPMCRMLRPMLSSVAQPKREQGEEAARLLHRMLAGQKVGNVILAPSLSARDSLAPPPAVRS